MLKLCTNHCCVFIASLSKHHSRAITQIKGLKLIDTHFSFGCFSLPWHELNAGFPVFSLSLSIPAQYNPRMLRFLCFYLFICFSLHHEAFKILIIISTKDLRGWDWLHYNSLFVEIEPLGSRHIKFRKIQHTFYGIKWLWIILWKRQS